MLSENLSLLSEQENQREEARRRFGEHTTKSLMTGLENCGGDPSVKSKTTTPRTPFNKVGLYTKKMTIYNSKVLRCLAKNESFKDVAEK